MQRKGAKLGSGRLHLLKPAVMSSVVEKGTVLLCLIFWKKQVADLLRSLETVDLF